MAGNPEEIMHYSSRDIPGPQSAGLPFPMFSTRTFEGLSSDTLSVDIPCTSSSTTLRFSGRNIRLVQFIVVAFETCILQQVLKIKLLEYRWHDVLIFLLFLEE